ncbi:hypothetical protein CK203_041701 [Vitis vinifera]|uniref:DUF4283 domain-containing protein n=1 Tax=Vitis vinifera TaxID=29760 RepID=A0A438HCP9_VITVI|nr:hypothetical protein CK203_041701 [Vitis vinifera]
MRSARRVEGEASRWNPRPSSFALDGRKGRCQILIVEKKRGVSTWIRLGLGKLRALQEGANPLMDGYGGNDSPNEELAGRRMELQEVRPAVKATTGLKGKLGLAKLERGRALLEFEDKREAYRVVSSGSREMGGVHLGLDFWKPKTGCWAEEEMAQEAWVKIFGLPVSLWSSVILKKIREECGGFVEIDERTRSMEEIQWARIRAGGETFLSAVEIRRRTEDRGDTFSRAEKRVGKDLIDTGTEGLLLPDDGRLLQENGSGLESRNQIHGRGPGNGPVWMEFDGSSSHGLTLGLKEQEKDEEIRREQRVDGFSMTDRALEEEAKRYALHFYPKGNQEEEEKIHSKELLEKTKFERELKRLECSGNYEGGNKQKAPSQGKGNQLIVVQ